MTELLPDLAWNFDEEARCYRAYLGGYPVTMDRDPQNGQLRATYVFNALDDKGRETERTMRVPLHTCSTVAEARVAVRDRIMESLSKVAPEFHKEIQEALKAELLKKYAENDERI